MMTPQDHPPSDLVHVLHGGSLQPRSRGDPSAGLDPILPMDTLTLVA
jgi:hypothetical protein